MIVFSGRVFPPKMAQRIEYRNVWPVINYRNTILCM